MGAVMDFINGLKPAMLMVMVMVQFTGINILYKLAAYNGMNFSIIVAYRFIFGTIIMVPVALLVERRSRPKLTWTVVFQAFLCGMLGGTLTQNLYLQSLVLTSATFASAMFNLVPAMTFILAVVFGLEKLKLKTRASKAKVLGTIFGIGGAMLLTFYKGLEINMWSTHVDLLNFVKPHKGHVAVHSNRGLGAIFSVGSCIAYALWLILQAKMSAKYPCPYSSSALMSLMTAIQSSVFALCIENDWSQWNLGWNIRLLTVVYAAIASCLMITMISWCVRMRGPVFVSIFSPLVLVLVAIVGSLVLNEKLHIGSILGAVLIISGLYLVLWGNDKEMKKIAQLVPTIGSSVPNTIDIVVDNDSNNNNISEKLDRNLSGKQFEKNKEENTIEVGRKLEL
ncbi:EamA domain-containing protein [Cephalotus follicularis]|uniref:WAT1-related protein n=1 Tax=Cephalotus follicularis TaxID=3775 RepID=A0A1Q3CW13_CEPFO|nr:EamA domain-containing protein [Cephalotus follicularis]